MLLIALLSLAAFCSSKTLPVSIAATQRALGIGRIPPSSLMEELSRLGKGGGGGPPPPPTTTTNAPLIPLANIAGSPDPGALQWIFNDYPQLVDLSGSSLPGILPDYNKACVVPWQIPPYWGYILPPSTCDRERAGIMSVLYDIETPKTWQLLQNWWGDARTLDQDFTNFESESSSLYQSVFGAGGTLQNPYGAGGYYSYATAIRSAATDLGPITNRLYQDTSNIIGAIQKQVDADSARLSSVSDTALQGLATAVQSAYSSQYTQQHAVNSQILLGKSNQRLAIANAALVQGVASVNVPSTQGPNNTMNSQMAAVSTLLKTQSGSMQVFNSTNELLLTQQMNQPFSQHLASTTLAKVQASDSAALTGFQSSATQATLDFSNRLRSGLAADSTNASATLQLRNQSSTAQLQNISTLLSAAIAQATANLTAIQAPLSLACSAANNTILQQLQADAATVALLDKLVNHASINASNWGSTVDPTTGSIENSIASKKADLLSQIASGALTSNSSMLQSIIVALGDIEKARNAMLQAAATSQAKMTAMLTQISAQLGLNLQDTIYLIGNLSSTVTSLKSSLSGSIIGGAQKQMDSAASMSGQLQNQLMSSAYAAANASLQAMQGRTQLVADGITAASSVLTNTSSKLILANAITTTAANDIKSTAVDLRLGINQNASAIAQAQAFQSQALAGLVKSLQGLQAEESKHGNDSAGVIGSLSVRTGLLGSFMADSISNFSKYATVLTQRTFNDVIDGTGRKLGQIASKAESDVISLRDRIASGSSEYSNDMKDLNASAMSSLSAVEAVQNNVASKAASSAASMDKLVQQVKGEFSSKTGANAAVLANAESVLQANLAAVLAKLYTQASSFTSPMSSQASKLAVSSGEWFGDLSQRLATDSAAIAADQAALDKLSKSSLSASNSARTGMADLSNAIAGFSNSSTFRLNNLTMALAALNGSISHQIASVISDFKANTTVISQNVSSAIQAIVEQYTATVDAVNAQVSKIQQSINSSGIDAQNGTLVQATLAQMNSLLRAQQQLAVSLDALRDANAASHSGNLSLNVVLPSFELANAVREILAGYATNKTWLSGLLSTVGTLASSTMQTTWAAVQQGQQDSLNAMLNQQAEAQYDILSQSGSNQQNSQLAQTSFDAAALAVANQNQALAAARFASANSAQEVMQDVTSSRAGLTAMLGRALDTMGTSNANLSTQLLTAQSSTDPATVRQAVSNILSSWDAFGQNALSSADQTFASAASVVQDQEVSMNQKAVGVGRRIVASLKQSGDDLSAINGLVRDLRRFANTTTAQIPGVVGRMSASIATQEAAFESQLKLQLSQIIAAAQAEAQQEIDNATRSFAGVVNATMTRLAAVPTLNQPYSLGRNPTLV